MRSIIIVFILMFLIPFANAGSSCNPFKKIEEAGLYDNEGFWKDYAKISAKGEPDEAQVMALVEKYTGKSSSASAPEIITPSTPTPRAAAIGKSPVALHHKAEKGLKKAPQQIRKKFDAFIALVREKGVDGAIHELKNNNWNFEYLKEEGYYSIRLNGGYRAAFDIKDNQVFVRNVGQHIYAH